MDLECCLKHCSRISNLIKENRQLYDTYISDYENRISSVQYSKGGRDFHRGYFCPSQIFDIICNVSRGHITIRENFDFMYGFDNVGQLIFARRSKQREFIKRYNDFELGITYSSRNRIEAISECSYEKGKIKQYFYYLCDSLKNRVQEMTSEIYDYRDDMVVVSRTKFLNKNPEIKSKYILSEEIYDFKLENNQIIEYDVTQNFPIVFPTITYMVSNDELRGRFC